MTTRVAVEPQRLARYAAAELDAGFTIEDVRLDASSELDGADAGSGRFVEVRIDGSRASSSRLRGLSLRDVLARGLDASNADWTGASMNGVLFEDCRLTGLQLPEAELREVGFHRCKLDLANLRMARLSQVTFEDCVLEDTDLTHARVERTRFSSCRIHNCEFRDADLSDVDLRGSELVFRGDVRALRGAIVTSLQLIDLSQALAQAVGLRVEDE